MNKIEKLFDIFAVIIAIIGLVVMGFIVFMFIMLARYNECRDTNFVPQYCEKYKNF